MKDIKIFKLINGDWFVSEVIRENDSIHLIKPLNIVVTGSGPAFLPIMDMLLKKNQLDILKKDVVYEAEPSTEVYNYYVEQTSSIIQPKVSDILQ